MADSWSCVCCRGPDLAQSEPMPPRRALRCMTLAMVAAALASQCLADTIILSNGDRITGKIQRIEKGKVVVLTDYAGEIKIDWQRISTLDAAEAMTVQLDDDTRLYGRIAGD